MHMVMIRMGDAEARYYTPNARLEIPGLVYTINLVRIITRIEAK